MAATTMNLGQTAFGPTEVKSSEKELKNLKQE
jgi:hypothetical protein